MAAPFPRWSDTALRVALVVIVLFVIALVAAPMIWMRTIFATGQTFEVDQPVQFDHRHHVGDDGIACQYCHTQVERSPRAGIPATEVCMGCHSQVWHTSPMLEPVRRAWMSGSPVPWRRVHKLPDFVFFNHSIHVGKGVPCTACHGRVDKMPLVQKVAPLTMGWCLDCHRAPEQHLVPLDRVADPAYVPKPGEGAELAKAYGTRHLTHCTTCHR